MNGGKIFITNRRANRNHKIESFLQSLSPRLILFFSFCECLTKNRNAGKAEHLQTLLRAASYSLMSTTSIESIFTKAE